MFPRAYFCDPFFAPRYFPKGVAVPDLPPDVQMPWAGRTLTDAGWVGRTVTNLDWTGQTLTKLEWRGPATTETLL